MRSVARPRRAAATATQAAANKASEAADAVLAWLQTQSGRILPPPAASEPAGETSEALAAPVAAGLARAMAEAGSASAPVTPAPQRATAAPIDLGPVPGERAREGGHRHTPLRLAHTDWLHHRLLITGPEAGLATLRTAAAGAGTVPWQLDFDHVEEDLFHLLLAPPAPPSRLSPAGPQHAPTGGLSLAGARILSGQLREAAAHRHALAITQVGHSRACPFDLHALLPVPDAILRCGPDDPAALAWLWTHWGTTQPLRHVAEAAAGAAFETRASEHARAGAAGEAVWVLTFWSADWTPWRALARLATKWPTLRFDACPTYDVP
jgi:hypothetical protein